MKTRVYLDCFVNDCRSEDRTEEKNKINTLFSKFQSKEKEKKTEHYQQNFGGVNQPQQTQVKNRKGDRQRKKKIKANFRSTGKRASTKNFVTLSRYWLLKGLGVRVNLLKGKSVTKII